MVGIGDLTWWTSVPIAFPEVLNLLPSTLVRWLMTAYSLISKGIWASLQDHCTHMHIPTYSHIMQSKTKILKSNQPMCQHTSQVEMRSEEHTPLSVHSWSAWASVEHTQCLISVMEVSSRGQASVYRYFSLDKELWMVSYKILLPYLYFLNKNRCKIITNRIYILNWYIFNHGSEEAHWAVGVGQQ